MAITQFGEWLPDRGEMSNPGLLELENLVPMADGYRTQADFVADPNRTTLDAPIQGAFSGRTLGGQSYTVAGTATKLYKLLGADWVDASSTGSPYGLSSEGRWSFDQHGGFVIATNREDPPEYLDVDGAAPDFVALHADASYASIVFTHRNFVILCDIEGRGVNNGIDVQEAGLHWSGADLPLSWPEVGTDAAADVQSDYQVLAGPGGRITAGVSAGEYALIFRERQVWRMDYVGGTTIFAFRKLDNRRGCILQDCAIAAGGMTYFPSEDGWMACDGARVIPIGHEKVDRWWRANQNWARTTGSMVVRDPQNRSVLWGICLGTSDFPSTMLGYHYDLGYWYQIKRGLQWLVTLEPVGELLDFPPYDTMPLDTVLPTGLADQVMDDLGRVVGGQLGGFDLANRVGTFESDTILVGFMGTGDIDAGRRMLCRGIRLKYRSNASYTTYGGALGGRRGKFPRTPSPTISAQIAGRLSTDEGIWYDYLSQPNDLGVVPKRISGRYFRSRFFINGACDAIQGYEPLITPMGSR